MQTEATQGKTMIKSTEAEWAGFYRAAGVGVVAALGFILLDMGLSFGGGDAAVGALSAVDWFAQFHHSWLLGLRNLGLFNVINTVVTIPLYLVLYQKHRKTAPAWAALALLLFVVGAAVYVANNRALSMLALSSQYAAATDTHRSLLAAAGTVLLAQAEDFTPGTFLGFFISSVASLLMMGVMARGKVFSRWIGLVGMVGTSCLLFFTISATFIPAVFHQAMILAMVGGLLMVIWYSVMAVEMFRLARVSGLLDPRQVGSEPQLVSGMEG